MKGRQQLDQIEEVCHGSLSESNETSVGKAEMGSLQQAPIRPERTGAAYLKRVGQPNQREVQKSD